MLLIYPTDFRFNLGPIVSILGTRFISDPPPFERIYHVSPVPVGSAPVDVIHPFRGTPLSEDEIRWRLEEEVWTLGPEDLTYR